MTPAQAERVIELLRSVVAIGLAWFVLDALALILDTYRNRKER